MAPARRMHAGDNRSPPGEEEMTRPRVIFTSVLRPGGRAAHASQTSYAHEGASGHREAVGGPVRVGELGGRLPHGDTGAFGCGGEGGGQRRGEGGGGGGGFGGGGGACVGFH